MEVRKKILLITYYWIPSGGVGVQRWIKMVKYLAEHYDVTVYAPSNPEYPSIDKVLEGQIPDTVKVIKNKIFEPYGLFRKFTFKKKDFKPKQEFAAIKKKSLLENIAVWIRGNFFIPDARKFWIKPSIRFLSEYLRKTKYDVVITNGTPHSVHLIALGLKKKFEFNWIADFRDPWTKVDYFDKLKLTSWAENKHKKKEKEVLQQADIVTTVSPSWASDFRSLGAKKVEVLYNGFDVDDFNGIKKQNSSKIIISHVGSFNEDRNKEPFWRTIRELIDSKKLLPDSLEIRLVGNTVASVKESVEKYQLQAYVNFVGNVTHKESLQEIVNADVLLLLLGDLSDKGRIPSKVFEYMASGNGVFALCSPASDVGDIVKSIPNTVVTESDFHLLGELLHKTEGEVDLTNSYNRKEIAFQLMKLIEKLDKT